MKCMRMIAAAAALGLLLVGLSRPTWANTITFTMSSSDDLSNVQTNSSFTVDVFVHGLNASSADILSTDLYVPTSLITGGSVDPPVNSIVPDPTDFGGSVFAIDSTNTEASGAFFDVSGPPINIDTTDDKFFTITLNTGTATGSGFVSFFDVFAYLDGDFSTNDAVIGTSPLAFSVQQGSGPMVSPLPSSLWGGAALMGVLGLAQLRRRRVTTTTTTTTTTV